MTKRRSNEQSIREVIGEVIKTNHLGGKLHEINLVNKWESLMGPMIAKNTNKMYISRGRLYLHIESAALRNELHFSRRKIVEIVNREAGEELIEDVVVK